MNAIKLPVEAYRSVNRTWSVITAERIIICERLDEETSKEISLALNCHDAMVKALEYYRDGGDDEGPCARAALAKVEDLRKL